MENQKSGFIPLYRSIRKKSWAKDVFLRTLWENILMDAARKPYTANFKGHVWQLQPGQLVVTAADLGLQLCDRKGKPISRDAVERMLSVFVREGMISIDGEKQKGRVITILNYAEYAGKIDNLPAHDAAHTTAHDDASIGAALKSAPAHEAAHTPAQHEQEGNNNNINNKPPLSPLEGKKAKRATQFPDDFSPTVKHQDMAAKLGVNLQDEFESFSDYHRSKGSTFKDWGLAFNTWLRNAVKFGKPSTKARSVARPSRPMNHIPEGFTG
ncbi:replication protein [Symbiopectobacterium purcellii]|uniref:replication protein n=1 Tax=Symbiopectobacterium purcellii TaxID=2871826 RepID=UPI002076A327|nr:replication protein [Symbiopectobacterium purcellii]